MTVCLVLYPKTSDRSSRIAEISAACVFERQGARFATVAEGEKSSLAYRMNTIRPLLDTRQWNKPVLAWLKPKEGQRS